MREAMKVIIELNSYISLELIEDDVLNHQIRIWFEKDTVNRTSAAVNIDDLKLALRKMTAK